MELRRSNEVRDAPQRPIINMIMNKKELKLHPSYWVLHKKLWQKEYDDLDRETAAEVMSNPQSHPAILLEKKVNSRIKESFLTRKQERHTGDTFFKKI